MGYPYPPAGIGKTAGTVGTVGAICWTGTGMNCGCGSVAVGGAEAGAACFNLKLTPSTRTKPMVVMTTSKASLPFDIKGPANGCRRHGSDPRCIFDLLML
jgi:hypothetical protein